MAFGVLNSKQITILKAHVYGREVHDLGCGDLVLSRALLELGADRIVAIDRFRNENFPKRLHPKISFVHSEFRSYTGWVIDVAFVSWPVNALEDGALLRLVERARTVIYLGKNTDGVVCGPSAFFDHMVRRELLSSVPDQKNSLIVVGNPLDRPRAPTGDEWAALNIGQLMTFDEAEKAAIEIGR